MDGYADGKGLLQWYIKNVPNTRYEGALQRGQLSGKGKLTMPDGPTYDGHWLAGKQQGKGVQSMPDGSRYEGEWKNGQPDGRGVFRNAAAFGVDAVLLSPTTCDPLYRKAVRTSMAATLSAVWAIDGTAVWGHAGDSRIFKVRARERPATHVQRRRHRPRAVVIDHSQALRTDTGIEPRA